MLYLLGEAGTGKSLVIDIVCQFFNNIGSIGSSFEEKFGLSFLYDKDIVVCDDLPKDIAKIFPQTIFQTAISGGKVPIAVKGGNGFTVDWTVPMLWAGNWFVSYIDKGQISRRMIVANFEKNITQPDVNLKSRIIEKELPALIYRCLLAYKNILDSNTTKDIWHICPQYFLEQQQELKMDRNPLFKFLTQNTRYCKGNVVLLEEIRGVFSSWMDKKISKLDNGTFYQVNAEYFIERIMICKHCNKESHSKCCPDYSPSDRTTKNIVRNLELINNSL